MPNLAVKIKYKYADKLQLSPADLISVWMFGIPLKDKDGSYFPLASIKKLILSAQAIISKYIDLKLSPERIDDIQDYVQEEFNNYGQIKLKFPPYEIIPLADDNTFGIEGKLADVRTVRYPLVWIKFKGRNLAIIPSSSGASGIMMNAFGATYPQLMIGTRLIPDFWHISYMTGFKELPEDIEQVIAKMSVILMFGVLGDVLNPAGLASQSLSIDGLSQSLSTIANNQGNVLNPRIKRYYDDLFTGDFAELKLIRNAHRGIMFEVV